MDAWDHAMDRLIDCLADTGQPLNKKLVAETLGDELLNETQSPEDWIEGLRAQGYPVE